ncbi:biopolymer transporter ExbD [Lentimicrobium sp. S6]|uniref:ExbD/TolR family protein n=1 Tax=Lentimicrobium sp. S6 TaxID=2735872 RepID=UPI001555C1F0|nr:biopolymer transporter ExbD [Lentimicrobium sp. S6]MBF8984752.1 biopolymer transporter ExbD [Lutibacter sp. B2]NPD47397.1 biopolymer transporter ExbD [Lentimicrobium sp. S6]
MAIKSRNKRKAEFNATSMSDLVFLLLIFFMITSTLISPNAIKLLLPSSSSKTMSKQNVTIYINDQFDFYLEKRRVEDENLESVLAQALQVYDQGTVVLRSDKSVPVQYVVTVIDAVNQINKGRLTKHKVILATKPK